MASIANAAKCGNYPPDVFTWLLRGDALLSVPRQLTSQGKRVRHTSFAASYRCGWIFALHASTTGNTFHVVWNKQNSYRS